MRTKAIVLVTSFCTGLLALSVFDIPETFIWNRTESVPKGLYWVNRSGPLEHGNLVVFEPVGSEKDLLEQSRFIGKDWPVLKRIAGLKGDEVCRCGSAIWINGEYTGTAIIRDDLPVWSGCTVLDASQVFLLNQHPRSLDGRYFGVQKIDQIAGTATPIWTR